MSEHRNKTTTDIHWNDRARDLNDSARINIDDLVQRQLENEFIFSHIQPTDKILEVGCGNGHLTQDLRKLVDTVDSFDFSENMVASAKVRIEEENNRFFVHSVLSPELNGGPYNTVVCVRVLINLLDLGEQILAINNMASWLRPGGKLVLVEGYSDGFSKLNEVRGQCGLEKLMPAGINFYSSSSEMLSAAKECFEVVDTWHSGMFDVLTRVVYPLLVGSENATGPAEFHDRILPLASALNPDSFAPYARLYGYALVKK